MMIILQLLKLNINFKSKPIPLSLEYVYSDADSYPWIPFISVTSCMYNEREL